MINENKVKMLTKLAVVEKKEGMTPDALMRVSRGRYVAKWVWWTLCASTTAFILILIVWSMITVRFETLFIDFINGNFYMLTHTRTWIEFAVYTAAFLVFALIYYNKKFSGSYERIDEYQRRRNNFEEFYTRKDTEDA